MRLYVRCSGRKEAPVHNVGDVKKINGMSWYKTRCGLWTNTEILELKVVKSSRVCWNCKRVLGWK